MAGSKAGSAARLESPMGRGEKRVKNRARKRLMVRFGVNGLERAAFTRNISETGLFLQTNMVFKPGTTIQIQIEFPDRMFPMWARVVWAKRVPPELAHILECGMGICYIDPSPEWIAYFKDWTGQNSK